MKTVKKIKKNATKKRIEEKIKGGIPFNDSATISKVMPQIKVVKINPEIAKKYGLKIIFLLTHLCYEVQQ